MFPRSALARLSLTTLLLFCSLVSAKRNPYVRGPFDKLPKRELDDKLRKLEMDKSSKSSKGCESCLREDARCTYFGIGTKGSRPNPDCDRIEGAEDLLCPCMEEACDSNFVAELWCADFVENFGETVNAAGATCLDACETYVEDCCEYPANCCEKDCVDMDGACAFFEYYNDEYSLSVPKANVEEAGAFYEDAVFKSPINPDNNTITNTTDILSAEPLDRCFTDYDGMPQLFCPCTDDEEKNSKGNFMTRQYCRDLVYDGNPPPPASTNQECIDGCELFLDDCCGLSSCFPKDSLVEVEGKGVIPMEALELGDNVRSKFGFSQVYAFGTRDLPRTTDFLKLATSSSHVLELSKNHIVFVGANGESKLADHVEVGDFIMLMPEKELTKIVSVEKIKKTGPIHPLTQDGTIVVNGLVASVHSVGDCAPVAKIGGYTVIDKHQFQQMLLAPLRVLCKISTKTFCSADNHAPDDGTHYFVDIVEAVQAFLEPESVKPSLQDDYDEDVNHLSMSSFLPLKVVFISWMIMFCILEHVLNLRFLLALTTVVAFFVTKRCMKIQFKRKVKQI